MKVIVCGGRDYENHDHVFETLDALHKLTPFTHVIEGGARGADRLARSWAISRGVPYTTVNAEWDRFGRRAGYMRNCKMASMKPDAVIAFPDGVGTKMMIDIAHRERIDVLEAHY